MNILSLFDGMACAAIALQRAQVPIDKYWAYEIDSYATKTASHNFPFIEQKGDVFKADFSEYVGKVDFLMGGSPCTYWSIAQRPDKRETTASGMGWDLFSQYVRALHEVKPKYFIYENNKSMSKDIYKCISDTFGFEPILINSALVSAQSRFRYYWVGALQADGTYKKVDISQPEDRGIILNDILDSGEDLTTNEKAYTLTASYGGAVAWNTIERHQRSMVAEPIRIGLMPTKEGNITDSQGYRIYSADGKAVTCNAAGGGLGGHTGLYAIKDGDKKKKDIYEVKNGEITIKDKKYPIKLEDGYYVIRKLSVNECKKLQTVPNWYEFPVSNSQAYKMLGNGWTVEVIAHLINGCL